MWLLILLALLLLLIIIIVTKSLKWKTIEIQDKHVLIAGASKGIGKELALLCFQRGSKVSLLARDKQCLEEARNYILSQSGPNANPDRIRICSIDVAKNYLQLCKAVQELESSFGPVFALFNLVGKATSLRFEDTPIEAFQSMINVNYLSTVNCIKAVLPTMISRKEGLIEITSSIAGLIGIYGYTAYSASKFALRGFAEALAMELKPYNISITMSFPPDTDTEGFAEENFTKPVETKLISNVGGLESPLKVADKILTDTLNRKFTSTLGLDGYVISTLCAGMTPFVSLFDLLVQTCMMGTFRLLSIFYLRYFGQIVAKCFKERSGKTKSKLG